MGLPARRFHGMASEMTERSATKLLNGATAQEIADLAGVSVRTAYRWRAGLRAVEVVCVDGWTARFARFDRRPPVRISAWERAA